MAGAQRRPGKGVVHPSDGGSQHSSLQVREALPRGRDQALHGLGRRPPRQRHGRELLRQPRKRTARPKRLPEPRRGKKGAYIVKALARDRGSRSVDSALERRERCAPQLRIGPAAVRIPLAPSKREKPAPRPISISRRGEGPAATAKHRLPLRPGSGIAVVRGPGPAACPLASPRGRFQAHTTRIRAIGRCRASQGFGHALTRTASNARRRSRPGASGSACLSVQGIEENRNVSDCVTPAPFVASSTAR